MKASAYNHFVVAEETVYAVNFLTRAAVAIPADVYRSVFVENAAGGGFDHVSEETASTLLEQGFLIEDDFDELAHVRYRTRQERFDTRQLGLVIAPTMSCNFNCHYCFESKTATTLSEIDQARLVALVAERLPGRQFLSVQWFGGEPLVAMPVIEKLSEAFQQLCSRLDVEYAATVITNGYLMTAAVSQRLAALGVQSVQITLDGDRSLHDRVRFQERRLGSFDQILANVWAAEPSIAINVRVHVAPYSVESTLSLLDTLAERGLQRRIDEIYFAPLFNYHTAMSGKAYATDARRFMNASDFAAVQVKLLSKADSLGFRTPDLLDVSYGICTAVRDNTLVVDSTGNLHKCYKDVGVEAQAIGDLETGVRASGTLQKWMDVEPPRDQECRSCKFLPVCLGGCSKQWHEGADKAVICTPLKFNTDAILRHYFERTVTPLENRATCRD